MVDLWSHGYICTYTHGGWVGGTEKKREGEEGREERKERKRESEPILYKPALHTLHTGTVCTFAGPISS